MTVIENISKSGWQDRQKTINTYLAANLHFLSLQHL